MIEVPNGLWDESPRKIMSYMNMSYVEIPPIKLHALENFCGKYTIIVNNEEHGVEIKYDQERDSLYADAFWPYMKLTPITPNIFEMESFPITFAFSNEGNKQSIIVTGDYDWSIVGNTLIKSN